MFINSLAVDCWESNRDMGQAHKGEISWNEIEKAIKGLDGRSRTMVIIGHDFGGNEACMTVSGGLGLYIAYITYDNISFHRLIDPNKSEESIDLTPGGEMGEFPAKFCIDLEKVLRAARMFSSEGKVDPSLDWEVE